MITRETHLPPGWCWTSVDEVANVVQYGSSAKTDETPSGVPVLRMGNIVDGRLVTDRLKYLPRQHSEFPGLLLDKNDLLFNRTNSAELVGKTAVFKGSPKPCSFASYLIRVRLQESCVADYLASYINSMFGRAWVASVASQQVGQANVNGSKLRALRFPLAPINEQQRIVAEIETQFTRLDAAVAALERVQANLKRHRASVLKIACEGRLVATEAKLSKTDGRTFEDGAALLNRVLDERRRRWEEQALSRLLAAGKVAKDERWKAGYTSPAPLKPQTELGLPDGWTLSTLDMLADNPDGAVQTGPFGAMLHTSEFVNEGVPVIAVGNLTGLGFDDSKLYFVTPRKALELARFSVQPNDILFARTGATLGKVCVAPERVQNWRMTGHILRVRLMAQSSCAEFITFLLRGSPFVRQQIESRIRGVTRPGFNTELLASLQLPLPPLAEQQRIVAEVERQLSVIQATERVVAADLTRIERLRQSILKRAFEGKLVPQDPADEPAERLLERIRAASSAAPKKKAAQLSLPATPSTVSSDTLPTPAAPAKRRQSARSTPAEPQ